MENFAAASKIRRNRKSNSTQEITGNWSEENVTIKAFCCKSFFFCQRENPTVRLEVVATTVHGEKINK